ncbi:MAG: MFS transporter, partial [Cyanobacteriota bacterium]
TGSLIGALLAAGGWLRGIYALDITALLLMALLLWRAPLPGQPRRPTPPLAGPSPGSRTPWLWPLLPRRGGGVGAQVPLAVGAAAFLPTATEAVVERTPEEHRGLAMALFSQCFALSGLLAPLLGGWMLDVQGHGAGLWLVATLALLLGLPLVRALA